MAVGVESWDDDDFQGDLFAQSISTVQTSLSSRRSVNSESNITEEDWQVTVSPNDDASASRAIQSAKRAGVPIPANVPASALMGGSIKRLGKKNSRQRLDDGWGEDIDIPMGGLTLKSRKPDRIPSTIDDVDFEDVDSPQGGLTLKPRETKAPARILSAFEDTDGDDLEMPAGGLTIKPRKSEAIPITIDDIEGEDRDGFDEWAEGSLGIRFAGTRKQGRNRSSSTSAVSPSLGSQTAESEEDELRGLELPEGVVDLQALLKRRQAAEAEKASIAAVATVPLEQPRAQSITKPAVLQDHDDFFDDLEVGSGDAFDTGKLTLHKNVKQKSSRVGLNAAARLPTTTLTFTDRPAATRIPRPVMHAKTTPTRLEPVMEPGAVTISRQRMQSTMNTAQLLRSKRSMPVMRSNYPQASKGTIPFLPPGSGVQTHHVAAKGSAHNLRRDSDPNRALSPPPRSFSRLSNAVVPDTPSKSARRNDFASKDLVREAAAKRTLTKPRKKRFFGDGSELEVFDDLPTSAAKESKFLKQPSMRAAPKTLRNIPSRFDLREHGTGHRSVALDRMSTPMPGPQTPRSPIKVFQESSNTPRYLRDTAASRIARESKMGHVPRARVDGPLMPVTTNWKAQIAARSPHTSPSASRNKGRRIQPGLIKPGDTNLIKNEKGMTFNPVTQRWEGNENVLSVFDMAPPHSALKPLLHQRSQSYLGQEPYPATTASPPRPALIAPMSANSTQNIQVVGGMVFDPVKMCWLKVKQQSKPFLTPSAKAPSHMDDEEEDPFADIEDLKDNSTAGPPPGAGASGPARAGGADGDEWLVGEEFDLGPEFIRRQKEEEIAWRRKCGAWFTGFDDEPRRDNGQWRWSIREIAGVSR